MALKPTIYKAKIDLSLVDENHYGMLNLTIACHPSENKERMMARVLAYCLHAPEEPEFTRGLCVNEEPDIWVKTLDDRIQTWIEIGEPAGDRIKKAVRGAGRVVTYSFNSKSQAWWDKEREKLMETGGEFFQFPWAQIQELAAMVKRTMDLSITLSDNTFYISAPDGNCEVEVRSLS